MKQTSIKYFLGFIMLFAFVSIGCSQATSYDKQTRIGLTTGSPDGGISPINNQARIVFDTLNGVQWQHLSGSDWKVWSDDEPKVEACGNANTCTYILKSDITTATGTDSTIVWDMIEELSHSAVADVTYSFELTLYYEITDPLKQLKCGMNDLANGPFNGYHCPKGIDDNKEVRYNLNYQASWNSTGKRAQRTMGTITVDTSRPIGAIFRQLDNIAGGFTIEKGSTLVLHW